MAVGFTVCLPVGTTPRCLARVAGPSTVALLSAWMVMNTLAEGTTLRLDARLPDLAAAALALWVRLRVLLAVVFGASAAVRSWP